MGIGFLLTLLPIRSGAKCTGNLQCPVQSEADTTSLSQPLESRRTRLLYDGGSHPHLCCRFRACYQVLLEGFAEVGITSATATALKRAPALFKVS